MLINHITKVLRYNFNTLDLHISRAELALPMQNLFTRFIVLINFARMRFLQQDIGVVGWSVRPRKRKVGCSKPRPPLVVKTGSDSSTAKCQTFSTYHSFKICFKTTIEVTIYNFTQNSFCKLLFEKDKSYY